MIRQLLALACAVALVVPAAGQEPKAARPKGKPAPEVTEAAKRLADEVESIEAHLQTKKAYILAAQVALDAAKKTHERVKNSGPAVTRQAIEDAELGVKAAEAQYMIRVAEADEVAVKLKHAKRRADEAQKAESKLDAQMRANREKVQANFENALAELKAAETELTRIEELVKRGIVAQVEIDRAREKRRLAAFMVQQIEKELQAAIAAKK